MKNTNRLSEMHLTRKLTLGALLIFGMIATSGVSANANIVEWDSVNGGGVENSTGGGNILSGTISQAVAGKSANGNTLREGYRIAIPQDAAVDCLNGGVACDASCYGPSTSFTFRNKMCGTAPCAFDEGSTQYNLYLWQTTNVYTHANVMSGGDWSDSNALCILGGPCAKLDAGAGVSFGSSETTTRYSTT